MQNRWLLVLIVVVVLGASATVTHAGTVNLWGIADGDTTYIEEQSAGFFRMDLYDPPPRETQQRFHDIDDPSITYGSPTFDGFPNDEDFRLGHIDYDDSGLSGGTGTAPVTALVLGVGTNPDDPSHINYHRWVPTITTVDSFSGTVDLVGGVVTGITLSSNVHLTINPIGMIVLNVPGTFSIEGALFEGHMELVTIPTPVEKKIIWDFGGTLTTVVELVAGDLNGDGWVDIFDVGVVSENWMHSGAPGIAGDANLDGSVNIFDVGFISEHWLPNPGGESVPEPSTVVPFTLGGLGLSVCGRRCSGRCVR